LILRSTITDSEDTCISISVGVLHFVNRYLEFGVSTEQDKG